MVEGQEIAHDRETDSCRFFQQAMTTGIGPPLTDDRCECRFFLCNAPDNNDTTFILASSVPVELSLDKLNYQ